MLYIRLYRLISYILYPLWLLLLKKRVRSGKEDPLRYKEKLAKTLIKRPIGQLIWFHAVSVGEINTIIPLIKFYNKKFPKINFLITTTTLTSCEIFKKNKLPNAIHQYLPIDISFIAKRFLQHWNPNLCIFTESEIWPNLLIEAKQFAPILLINARLSDKSFLNWKRFKSFITNLLKIYTQIFPSTHLDVDKFSFFYKKNIKYLGNLKNAAPPMPYNNKLLKQLKKSTAERKIVLFASTHRGEEEMIVHAHNELKIYYENLLTIIVPRHIDRAAEIVKMADRYKLNIALHTESHHIIAPDTELYIANTMGELGVFYRLSDIAFVGGSLIKRGGHNILEPAKLGLAILSGAHTFNFTETVEDFTNGKALIVVNDQKELFHEIKKLLDDKEYLAKMKNNALNVSRSQDHIIDLYVDAITANLANY